MLKKPEHVADVQGTLYLIGVYSPLPLNSVFVERQTPAFLATGGDILNFFSGM